MTDDTNKSLAPTLTPTRRRYIWLGSGVAMGALGAVLAIALVLPGAVEAARSGDGSFGGHHAGPGKHLMKMFLDADTDADRRVSVPEFKAATAARFTGADADEDGEVTQEEALNHMMERVKEHIDKAFDRVDLDESGTVSEQELAERMLQRFGRMDRNDDGFLSGDDLPNRRGGRHNQTDSDVTEPDVAE